MERALLMIESITEKQVVEARSELMRWGTVPRCVVNRIDKLTLAVAHLKACLHADKCEVEYRASDLRRLALRLAAEAVQ